jgi:hypothetical protein
LPGVTITHYVIRTRCLAASAARGPRLDEARLRLCAAYAAYWSGRPEQSADLARSGLEYLADGQNAAQPHLFGGLASARLGDAGSAHQADQAGL